MNESPIEARLRRDLAEVAHAPLLDGPAVLRASRRATARRLRRRRAVGAVAAVGVIGVGTVGLWSLDGRVALVADTSPDTFADVETAPATVDTATTTVALATDPSVAAPATEAVESAAAWGVVGPDPRGVLSNPAVVWTGREAIVVGGVDAAGAPSPTAAAFTPRNGRWRLLADPPNADSPGRIHPLAVWTGTEMVIVGGDNPDGSLLVSYGTAYDVATDTWRVIASPPTGFVSDRSPFVWTGSELFAWPSDAGGSAMAITPIAYDPATDTWRDLPAPPLERRQRAASVWTGAQWLVWGGSSTDGTRSFSDGAIYDPSAGVWQPMADSPLSARRTAAVWTGTEMIMAAGSTGGDPLTGNGEVASADGAAFDPADNAWRSIADGFAHPGFAPVWTGTEMLMFAKSGAVAYDPATDRWKDGCCNDGDGFAGPPVWTGTQVLLLGSFDASSGGAAYIPAP